MYFSLSIKNIKRSFKDYAIYFLTLVFGVAIFYIFNSIESQQSMIQINQSKAQMIESLNLILGYVSIFVSFILGFLIIYANNFLIRRRKKEFGIYMTLGMGRKNISKILLIETMLVGLISLFVGLVIGVFGSQFMSILVSKLFEIDMSSLTFVFSTGAFVKTIIYFGLIYLCVMIFNTLMMSKYKLIDLLNASKKSEKFKINNPIIAFLTFSISILCLGIAYYMGIKNGLIVLDNRFLIMILLGIVGTLLFFMSLSGFILKVMQMNKKIYYKGLNMFVLRQLNSKINTTVVSITVICLMLFITIGVLSTALSLNDMMTRDLKNQTQVDIGFTKYSDDLENQEIDSITNGFENKTPEIFENFSEYFEYTTYYRKELILTEYLKEKKSEINAKNPFMNLEQPIKFMKLSEYNKLAEMYNNEKMYLKDNQYMIVSDVEVFVNMYNKLLLEGEKLIIDGKEYTPLRSSCFVENLELSPMKMNFGMFVVPDDAITNFDIDRYYFSANYKGESKEEKDKMEDKITLNIENIIKKDIFNMYITKLELKAQSMGIVAICTFLGIYLGIIFLIASAAILALKQLSESSDNKQRYLILRKIGTDEKMINKSLFTQIAIFFMLPLGLAIVHSVVGITMVQQVFELYGKGDLLSSIILTSSMIIMVYGGYFVATYFGSKNIIKEN